MEIKRCKNCSGTHIVKHGKIIKKGGPVQRYVCCQCGYNFTEDAKWLKIDGFNEKNNPLKNKSIEDELSAIGCAVEDIRRGLLNLETGKKYEPSNEKKTEVPNEINCYLHQFLFEIDDLIRDLGIKYKDEINEYEERITKMCE